LAAVLCSQGPSLAPDPGAPCDCEGRCSWAGALMAGRKRWRTDEAPSAQRLQQLHPCLDSHEHPSLPTCQPFLRLMVPSATCSSQRMAAAKQVQFRGWVLPTRGRQSSQAHVRCDVQLSTFSTGGSSVNMLSDLKAARHAARCLSPCYWGKTACVRMRWMWRQAALTGHSRGYSRCVACCRRQSI